MRDYSKISPMFWVGETGRALRSYPDAQRVALYLLTCPSANMIGLYYLPLPTLYHEVGISQEGASKALRRISEVGFAYYDDHAEYVFIPEMAKHQIGESIRSNDKRVQWIEKEIETHKKTKYFNAFMDRYRVAYHLKNTSPFEAPSKPLRSPFEALEKEKEKEKERDNTPPTPPGGCERESQETSPSTTPGGNEVKDTQTWKSDFPTYQRECQASLDDLLTDPEWVAQQEELNPGVDIELSLKKARVNYWETEEAWKKKRRQKIQSINWTTTWQNAVSNRINRVYKNKDPAPCAPPQPRTYAQCQDAERRDQMETLRKLREEQNAEQTHSHIVSDLIEHNAITPPKEDQRGA